MSGASEPPADALAGAARDPRPAPGGFVLHGDADGGSEAVISRTLLHVCEQLTTTLGVWECSVYEYVAARDCLVAQAIWSRALEQSDIDFVGIDNTINRHRAVEGVFRHGGVVVVQVEDELPGSPDHERMCAWGEQTALYASLELDGTTLGLLELVERRERREFSETDLRLVTALADVAAVAIGNARSSQRQSVANARLSALVKTGRALTATVDLEEVLSLVAESSAAAMDVPECLIYEYDARDEALVMRSIYEQDPGGAYMELGLPLPLADWPNDRRILLGREVVEERIDDDSMDPATRAAMLENGELSALSVPLWFEGDPVGILVLVETRKERRYSEHEVELARGLGEQAAVAIHNARLYRRLERQNSKLSALLGSSRALTSTVLLEEVLQRLAAVAAEALSAPSCYIYEYDGPGDAILWRSEYHSDAGHRDPDPPGTAYPLDDYPWDREVLESGRMRLFTVDDPTLPAAQRKSMCDWDELSMLTVPLRFGDQTVGMMEIAESSPERTFDTEEMELARALGEQAAAAIRNAQWYRRESWRNERLVKVLDISRLVSSSLDADAVVGSVRSRVGALFPHRPTDVDVVVLQQAAGGAAGVPAATPDDALVTRALRELQATQAIVDDGRRLVVPLANKGGIQGWLRVFSPSRRCFDQDEIELLQILANQAAAALDNTRLYEALAQQAITDGLTGLYNHRFFYERLRDEVVRARRYDLPLSLLMMDLDDFKTYNDRFGHPAGDGVLRRVAEIMQAQLRSSVDVAARYGGEEFAVILPHTEPGGAEQVGRRLSAHVRAVEPDLATPRGALVAGERVRHSIEAERFPGRRPDETAQVTISVGIASLPVHGLAAEDLVGAADRALYQAKQHGKNRVEVVE
jgi:diguanylate cyclase (GGDEF)-like protein